MFSKSCRTKQAVSVNIEHAIVALYFRQYQHCIQHVAVQYEAAVAGCCNSKYWDCIVSVSLIWVAVLYPEFWRVAVCKYRDCVFAVNYVKLWLLYLLP